MSITIKIKNLDMPIGCQRCKFFHKLMGKGFDYSYACVLGAKEFPMPWIRQLDNRAVDCPIVGADTESEGSMKREEAIDILEYHKEECEEDYWVARAEALEMAIKALKQESIIDKIRAEIEQNAYPIVHGVNNHEKGMTLYGILQVIDKYKAESEVKE